MIDLNTNARIKHTRRPQFYLPARLPNSRHGRQSELRRTGQALSSGVTKTQSRRLIRHIQVVFAEQLVDLLADDLPTTVGPRRNGDTAYFLLAGDKLSGCWAWLYGREEPLWPLRVKVQIGGWFQRPSRDGLLQLGIASDELNQFSPILRRWELTLLSAELSQVLNWVCRRIVAEERGHPPPSCPVQLSERSSDPTYLWTLTADAAYRSSKEKPRGGLRHG